MAGQLGHRRLFGRSRPKEEQEPVRITQTQEELDELQLNLLHDRRFDTGAATDGGDNLQLL